MTMGLEHDPRRFRSKTPADYYEAKAASEKHVATAFPLCKNCKQEIVGKTYTDLCYRCHNEGVKPPSYWWGFEYQLFEDYRFERGIST